MAQKITTIPLFKSRLTGTQGTGGTSISDVIPLRDISAVGNFAVSYSIAATNGTAGAGTSGSSVWEYLGCPVFDGTYLALGTFGTFGASLPAGAISFSPVTIPFMKIKAVTGTSNPAVITAELHVR
jgi:hypothetical protein